MLPRTAVIVLTVLISVSLACDAADSSKQRKRMTTDQPMDTGMMKPGMKKGDVGKAAEKKARKLEPMMEQEEKSMPPAKPAP